MGILFNIRSNISIADKVAKQFKKLYPEIIENNEYGYTYNDFVFINMISYSSMSTATSSKSRAESYSSGGGGFSSGGGGGGSSVLVEVEEDLDKPSQTILNIDKA